MNFLGDYTLRLGYVSGLTKAHLIVRPKNWSRDKKVPPLGLEIYDEKANSIGRITDIIGPVFRPYFKIKPSRPNLSSSYSNLIGEPLYTMPEARGKGKIPGAYQSKSKGKNVKDKRQSSNKSRYGKSSNTRSYSKNYKPRDKSPK